KVHQTLSVAIEDRHALLLLVRKYTRRRVAHVTLKRLFALVTLYKQRREVSRKTLTQPQIGPRRLGHRITKPLVRDLVRNQRDVTKRNAVRRAHAGSRGAVEQRAREHDRARVFHAAITRRADNQRELLIRIRRNSLSEELD